MAEEKKPKAAKAPKVAADGAETKKASSKAKAAPKAKAEGASASAATVDGYTPRMRKHFDEVVRAELTKQFG